MNKSELAANVALSCSLSKKDAAVLVDAVLSGIAAGLVESPRVALHGFGTFETKVHAARAGTSSLNGKAWASPAHTGISFHPARAFLAALPPPAA